MKVVEIDIKPIRETESVVATVVIEAKEGDEWNRKRGWDLSSKTDKMDRRFMLEDNERLVIEGKALLAPVYNQDQRAAQIAPTDPAEQKGWWEHQEAVRQENIQRETNPEPEKKAEEKKTPPPAPAHAEDDPGGRSLGRFSSSDGTMDSKTVKREHGDVRAASPKGGKK